MLMVRSHFHGEEEEEGRQEGRQEEEGPRLNHPLRWSVGEQQPWRIISTRMRSRDLIREVR
jgi:hypothetical protein